MKKSLLAAAITLAATPAFAEIDPIVIEYSSRELISQLPQSGFVKIFDREIIQNSSAKSIGEFLAMQSTVQFYDNQGDGFSPTLGMRGFGPTAAQNTLIMLNGVPLNTATTESPLLTEIPLSSVAKIEVTTGSNAVDYGNGTVAGMINIVTTPSPEDSAQIQTGSFGLGSVTVTKSEELEGGYLSITGSALTWDGYRDHTDRNEKGLSVNFLKDGSSSYQRLFANFKKLDDKTLSGSTAAQLAANHKGGKTKDTNEKSTQIINYVREDYTDEGVLNSSFGFSRSEIEGTVSATKFEQDTSSYKANAEYLLESTGIAIGTEVRYDSFEFKSPTGTDTRIADNTQMQSSLYVRKTTNLDPSLTVSVGGRAAQVNDKVDRTYLAYGPPPSYTPYEAKTNIDDTQSSNGWNLSARKAVDSSLEIYSSIDKSFRFATVDEQQKNLATPGTLKPQESNTFQLGLSRFMGDSRIDIEVYDMEIDNEIAYQTVGSSGGNFNVARTDRQGGLINLETQVNDHNLLSVNLNWVDSEVTGGTYKGKKLPLVPSKSIALALQTDLGNSLESNINARFESEKYLASDWNNEGKTIDKQTTVDWSITKTYESLTVTASVNNVFDADNYSYGVWAYNFDTSSYNETYIPSLPRNFSLSATKRF